MLNYVYDCVVEDRRDFGVEFEAKLKERRELSAAPHADTRRKKLCDRVRVRNGLAAAASEKVSM